MDEVLKAFWATFLASVPDQDLPNEPTDVFAFGNTPEMADTLGELVVRGVKSATTSALWAYEDGEPLLAVGDLSIVMGGDGRPLYIIQTTQVKIKTFFEVDATFAYDEGEGDRSLRYWRRAHKAFFGATLPATGHRFSEEIPVVCERFRVVYAPSAPSDRPRRIAGRVR